MWIVPQAQGQFAPCLGFGVAQRAFNVHTFTGRCRSKTMYSASLNIQLIAGLPNAGSILNGAASACAAASDSEPLRARLKNAAMISAPETLTV